MNTMPQCSRSSCRCLSPESCLLTVKEPSGVEGQDPTPPISQTQCQSPLPWSWVGALGAPIPCGPYAHSVAAIVPVVHQCGCRKQSAFLGSWGGIFHPVLQRQHSWFASALCLAAAVRVAVRGFQSRFPHRRTAALCVGHQAGSQHTVQCFFADIWGLISKPHKGINFCKS